MKRSISIINIFIGLEDHKHFINEYQEQCDVIQKLIDAEKWVLRAVRINLARNWKRSLPKPADKSL